MTLSTKNLQKQQDQKNKSKSPRKFQKQTNETNSTASEFSDNNSNHSNSNSSPARSFVSESNTNNSSIGSSQAEVFQMLLLHKKVALENNLKMKVEGFPDITLLPKEVCAEKIGYKEKKIPFRMRGELSPSVHKDVSMRSCISRDNGSARSMYSCLPVEGEKSLRVLPREMSRRARMEERRNNSKRSNRSMNDDKSPCNLKLKEDDDIDLLKFDNSEIIVNSESNEALLDNSGNTVGIQVTRRATVVDIPPFTEIENQTKTSQTRGRSTGRRGENNRDRSVSQFSSRKERAAFFINLKNEKHEQRSVSPYGHSLHSSPEPTSSRSVRSTSSKKSSYSHFGQGNGDKLTFGMSAGKSDEDFFAARMGEGVVKKDEVKPVKSEESFSSRKSQSRDTSIESKNDEKTRRTSIESLKEQKQILKEIIEKKSKKSNKTVFTKSDTQMSILGEAEPFQRGFAGQKTMQSSETRSQSRGRSMSNSIERQVTADGQTMANMVDFSKVDTKRFSREPSLEPIFGGKTNSLVRCGSVEPVKGFKATPFAGSSSVRGTSLPPKPSVNLKGTLIDISLVNEKLENMAIDDEVKKGEKKGEFLSTTPNFPRSRSRSQSPEPDARSRQLLAAGPSGGIGFRRSRSPVAVRQ